MMKIMMNQNLTNKNYMKNGVKKKNGFYQKDTILYFMISPYASTLKKVSWAKIADAVEKTLFELAKINPKIKFIFKTI